MLGVSVEKMMPNDLLRAILKAPVDLLWNGGIGTYVKATTETHLDVGDRSNDAIRINGHEVRARVVCEGGNLGLTQLARVEYNLAGGHSNPDFIDNSGGVDCSDHEVNIKILLNAVVRAGDMTEKQRNNLLAEMTQEVAELVLRDNYEQAEALSLAVHNSVRYLNLYEQYLNAAEADGLINRALEFLPSMAQFQERRSLGLGLSRPELAVLLSYSKIILKIRMKETALVKEAYLSRWIEMAFPKALRESFGKEMRSHYLAADILVTQLANRVIGHMGMTFVYQLQDETGSSLEAIIRAYTVAAEVFDLDGVWSEIRALGSSVVAGVQYDMMLSARRLVRRATRWLLRNHRQLGEIDETIQKFRGSMQDIILELPHLLLGVDQEALQSRKQTLLDAGVPPGLANRVAALPVVYHALNVVEIANRHQVAPLAMAEMYFALIDRLHLLWFRDQVNEYPVLSHWSVLAKAAYKGDLDWISRELAIGVFLGTEEEVVAEKLAAWSALHDTALQRWDVLLAEWQRTDSKDFAVLFVALRELLDLARHSGHNATKYLQ